MVDRSKLHPDHAKFYDQLESTLPKEAVEKIYSLHVELNKHPKKDWAKVGKKFLDNKN